VSDPEETKAAPSVFSPEAIPSDARITRIEHAGGLTVEWKDVAGDRSISIQLYDKYGAGIPLDDRLALAFEAIHQFARKQP
jgi:hypothetical protein